MRRRLLALPALLAAACGREAPVVPVHRSLWSRLDGAALEIAAPPDLPAGIRLADLRDGIAVLDVPLRAADARRELTTESDGVPYVFHRWDLPLPVAPEILSRSLEPLLAGLDLPRFVDPAVPLDASRGTFFVGPAVPPGSPVLAKGGPEPSHCLRVVVPETTELPEELRLRYAVEAPLLAGTPLVAERAAAELVRGRSAAGQRTTEALKVPAGARLRVPLPAHGAGWFRGRFAAGPADGARSVVLRVGDEPPLERLLLARGGAIPVELRLPPADGGWLELVVEGPPGSLLALEEPRLVRAPAEGDPPDVCLVVVDTLRADRASDPDRMPHLVALADECLVFTDCWATCSWTLPSVATMLTSNHGGQHQAWLNDQPLGEGVDTLGELFQRAGYRTAAFTGGVFVDQVFGLDRGFGTFDSSAGGVRAVVERAEAWLDAAREGPRFFLVHTYEVHAPYEPPAEARERVLARHPGVLGDREPEPGAFHDDEGVVDGDLDAVAALLSDLYDAEVRHADAVLGEFLAGLRQRGVLDGAVLAVTSDHGEEFGEHGLLGHTDTLYREQLHVPFLLRLPGGARGGEVDARPVSQLDLAPTLLDAAGLSAEGTTCEGRSLLGGGDPSPIYATRHIAEIGVLRAMREGFQTLVDGPYIYARGALSPERYDLAEDPFQQRNLHGADGGEELFARFRELRAHFDGPKVVAPRLSSAQVRQELRNMGYGH